MNAITISSCGCCYKNGELFCACGKHARNVTDTTTTDLEARIDAYLDANLPTAEMPAATRWRDAARWRYVAAEVEKYGAMLLHKSHDVPLGEWIDRRIAERGQQ